MKEFLDMVKVLYKNPYDVILGRCKNKKCIFILAKDEPNAVESNILEQFVSAGLPIVGIISGVKEGTLFGISRYDYSQIADLAKEAQVALGLPGFMLYTIADYFIENGLQPIAVVDGAVAADRREYVFNHLDDYYETYQLLGDELSKRTFIGDVLAETTYCLDYTVFATEPQYMLNGFTLGKAISQLTAAVMTEQCREIIARWGQRCMPSRWMGLIIMPAMLQARNMDST